MTTANVLASLLAPLEAMQRLMARFNDQGLIIGGVAASLLGRPRLTADVDAVLLVSTDDLPHLIQAAAQEGLSPRIADAEAFARRNRILLLRHEESGIDVDISLGILPFEVEAVERGIVHLLSQVSLRLPTPEDLIIFKAVAHRPQDLLDIQSIIASHPDLDRARVEYWMRQFAQALDMPELWDDIAKWL
jgi:hypothetical protein